MAKSLKKNIKYKIKELEVHLNKNGWLVELLKANEVEKPIKQLHVASIKPGRMRGNHYHKKRIEWFFIVAGKTKLSLYDIKTGGKVSFRLSEKNPRVITIFPNVLHIIENTGSKMAYLVSAQSDIYNPERPDAFSWKNKIKI